MDDGAIDPMSEENGSKTETEPTTATVQPIPTFNFEGGGNSWDSITWDAEVTEDVMNETEKE
jgi:hypothetical protein